MTTARRLCQWLASSHRTPAHAQIALNVCPGCCTGRRQSLPGPALSPGICTPTIGFRLCCSCLPNPCLPRVKLNYPTHLFFEKDAFLLPSMSPCSGLAPFDSQSCCHFQRAVTVSGNDNHLRSWTQSFQFCSRVASSRSRRASGDLPNHWHPPLPSNHEGLCPQGLVKWFPTQTC